MNASDCIFCRIVTRQIPAQIVFEDDHVLAFRDLNPQAPVHILTIPKKHAPSLTEVEEGQEELLGRLLVATREIAKTEGLPKNGYRVVINSGANAGQTVFHLHIHLLGGRSFSWPPG